MPGGPADRCGQLPHLLAQLVEQLVFPLGRPGPQLQDATLAGLELGRDEALLVGQGLTPDPVLGHPGGPGPAHREEVAEAAVELQPQGGDAAEAALLLFLGGQPLILVVEPVAQPIEAVVDSIVDQPPR